MNTSYKFIPLLFFFLLGSISFAQKKDTIKIPQGLAVNTKAPVFTAQSQDSSMFVLTEALKNGPVVLVFYRGQWCPVCNRHLSHLQDSLSLIYDKGATVVAVSPEKPEYISETIEKTKAKFILLYDEAYKISNAYDVTFTPPKKTRMKYNRFLGADLKHAHSDTTERLPVPATYIIGNEGTIIWRHFDINYKNRSTVKEILDHL